MTNQTNRPNEPQDAELDSALRKMTKEIHPRPAFVAQLRGELEQQAAHPRRDFWSLLRRARPWLAQAVLIAALAALVLVAGTLTGRLFAPDGGEFREIGANLTPSAAQPASESLPAGALARLGKGKIQSIDAAPDGRIVVGSTAGLCVYNTGLAPDWCRWTDSPVHEARFDSTGAWLAVRYSGKNVVEIWDAALGQVIASREFTIPLTYTSPSLPNPNFFIVNGIAWEPAGDQTGSKLAVVDTNQGVSAWDWQNGAIAWGPFPVEGVFLGVEWVTGSEGESIVALLTPEYLHLIDGVSGQTMNSFSGMAGTMPGSLLTLDRALQGRRIAVGADERVSIFHIEAWNPALDQSIPHPAGRFYDIALSPDGEHIATLTNDGQIVTFDLRNGQEMARLPAMALTPMEWNPADGRLYYASADGSLASFDGSLEGTIIVSGHTLAPQFAAWREDGTVVTASGRFIYNWDPSTQSLASFSEMTLVDTVMPVGLSRDGSRALFFDLTVNRMIVWDVSQNQPLHDLQSSRDLYAVTLSPDGTRLAAVNEDGQIFTWKLLENGTEQRDLTGITGFTGVDALAFHPDGEQIAVAYTKEDGSPALELHDIASQQKILDIPMGDDPASRDLIRGLEWSVDEQFLGAVQGNQTVIWQTPTWERYTHVSQADHQDLRVVAFNSIRGFASAGRDVLYYTVDGSARSTFRGHAMTVTDLAFRPDGEALASASNDGTVILWDLGAAELPQVEVRPTETPLPLPTATAITLQEYTVVEGDTCGGIAYTYNISVSSLIALNNLSPECDNLVVGQVLRIPYPTPTPRPGYPVPIDPTGTVIAEAYPVPGLTITPTPTRTTMPGQPTPLPDATQHNMPDTAVYDITQTKGIAPDGSWRWYALRGECKPGALCEQDLNIITAASTDGTKTWVLEEYTPHGLGEGRPTGFVFSTYESYLYFYDEGTPDGCGQPWQANLRRIDLETGIVEPVAPVSQPPLKKFVFSPDFYRISMMTRTDIEIHNALRLQPGETSLLLKIPIPFQPPADWSIPEIIWQPSGTSTLLAFEIVSPPEDPCSTPSPDQQRWTVVVDSANGTAWSYLTPSGYTLDRWKEGEHWSQQLDPPPDGELVYRSPNGSEITVNPRTGEIIP